MHTIHQSSVSLVTLRLIWVKGLLKTMHQPFTNYAPLRSRETKLFNTLTFVRI